MGLGFVSERAHGSEEAIRREGALGLKMRSSKVVDVKWGFPRGKLVKITPQSPRV